MNTPPIYLQRDLSLLEFNRRILQEADDPTVPLLERLVFLGIFSNNIDELYRTRLARQIERLRLFGKGKKNAKNLQRSRKVRGLLNELNGNINKFYADFDRYYAKIRTELEANKVFFLDETQLDERQGDFVRKFFHEKVRQTITPILLDKMNRTDFLREQSVYLVVRLEMEASDEAVLKTADLQAQPELKKPIDLLIEVPTGQLSRFVVLPPGADKNDETNILFLDDVIRYYLPQLARQFGFEACAAWSFQLTRDEDVELDKDRKDYIKDIRRGIESRRFGDIVRLVHDRAMPEDLQHRIAKKLGVKKRFLTAGGRYQHLNDLVGIGDAVDRKDLCNPPFEIVPCRDFSDAACSEHDGRKGCGILDVVREKDVLLSYPYQSFQNLIDMLLQASVDPRVKSVKMTIYRAAKNSRVINALVNAARNGKDVTVYVELQASFDEEANIGWANLMDAEGIQTVYYAPGGLKVHSKLLLIRREEDHGRTVDYTAIGTGNPNEKTSRIYCDYHLLTSDPRLTSDVAKVFKLLESDKLKKPKFEAIVVSPFATRKTFMDLLDREIENVKRGVDAWAIIKLNNLADRTIVDKIYEASQAGVKIQCIIRGICVLVPGIKGLSENITAIRIVDRFLEHARVMVFANRGEPLFFMGSADWMGRNFDERVEVTTPVFDQELQQQLMQMLEIQLHDNVKAAAINDSDSIIKSKKKIRSQIAQYEMLREKNS